jgi:hypothetical protein
MLAKDWEGLYRRYPDQAIFALNDDRVVEALEKRFRADSSLENIKSLPYDFQTGLNCVYFEFSHAGRPIGLPSSRSFLVVMGGNCDVVGVIDPFDPDKPNAFMPARALRLPMISPLVIKNFSQVEPAPVNTSAD